MQLNSPALLTQFRHLLQGQLFPVVESSVGSLSKQAQLLVSTVSLLPLSDFTRPSPHATGRPRRDRLAIATAFLAKAIFNLPTTRHLLDRLRHDPQLRRLCGFDSLAAIPAESTFSRAFAEFARAGLPSLLHTALIDRTQHHRSFDYIARDSTAIPARERFPEPPATPKKRKKRAKPKPRAPRKPFGPHRRESKPYGPARRAKAADRLSRLKRQQSAPLDAMLADLPTDCSLGVKTSSSGHQQYWRGYKLHCDVTGKGRFIVSCVLTSASLHDSQVAIPLMVLTRNRVHSRCDVMDSAYDAQAIRDKAAALGRQTLIKPVNRRNKDNTPAPWSEDDKERFKIRTVVEQIFGRLKDEFGGRHIYVRGASKVMAHLMFGILALTTDEILRDTA